ncbi:MAG: hypothetical protein L6R42_004046 [Xanthoria sp. 1 TBL-2021]|nr:MAG: hypothetical protein L6R42_004046 [Xanthoria sp. 1 TBL-2021]
MPSTTPKLGALQQVTFGVSKFYANSPNTQKALDMTIRDQVKKDPELDKTAVTAELKSGLHPNPGDPRPHWTFELLDQAYNKFVSLHITPQQVKEALGYLPDTIEAEEKRVVEKAGTGQGKWNLRNVLTRAENKSRYRRTRNELSSPSNSSSIADFPPLKPTMQKAISRATLQSAFLSLCSSLVATFLTPKNPPILALVIYSILATPPNYLWQQYLERKLPGYQIEKHESNGEVKGAKSAGGGVTIKRKLNVANTLMKVLIDQTLGSVVNVALHLGGVRALQGVPVAECLQVVRIQTWPLMIAGYKLWPLVSLLNFTLIPVEQRTVVGSLVGLGWGVFLALRAAR